MCVPYSFCVTAKGEILNGKNLEHHTAICERHNVDYDSVLKPEYQIWDRKLKDLEPSVDLYISATRPFLKDGMLKERFYRLVENHINEKFPNWEAGLDYFGENWDTVKRYAPTLSENKIGIYGGDYDRTKEKFFDALANNEGRFIQLRTTNDLHNSCVKVEILFFLREWGGASDQGHDSYYRRSFTISHTEIMAYTPYISEFDTPKGFDLKSVDFCLSDPPSYKVTDLLKEKAKQETRYIVNDICRAVNRGEIVLNHVLTFDDFAKQWSKKENRVLCWQN